MKRSLALVCSLLLIFALTACSAILPQKPTETPVLPEVVTTEPAFLTATPLPPTSTPTITPSPSPYQPFEAVIQVDNLQLREGPGFLLDSLGMYPQDDKVSVLGRAPGWSWLYVRTSDGKQGWMKLELLKLEGNYYDVPEVEPDGFVIVKGHVYTQNGNPASHITVTLLPDGEMTPGGTDAATTDILGRYYFFLPPGTQGNWSLQAMAYGCESNAVNQACSLLGTFPEPLDIIISDGPQVWYNLQLLP